MVMRMVLFFSSSSLLSFFAARVSKAMNSHGQLLRDVVQGICFVTHPSHITEARRQWERRTTNAIMDYIVVPALPRKALVEWQVWLHSHNDKFDCKSNCFDTAPHNNGIYGRIQFFD